MRKRRHRHLPDNTPAEFLRQGRAASTKTLVACMGDSLTQGQLSANYVKLLQDRLSPAGYAFINAGVNGDLTYNLLQRLDDILRCSPDVVILLIGTNDINATFSQQQVDRYQKSKQIPVTPDLEWSTQNLETLFRRILSAGVKHCAVSSIPMLGENLGSELNRRAEHYNTRLRELALKQGVDYLPFYERLLDALPKTNHAPVYRGKIWPMLVAAFRYKVLKQSWNTISDKQGLYFLTDHIHLNERAATILLGLIEPYLRGLEK